MLPEETPPRWQRVLRERGIDLAWIDEFSRSPIADLSLGKRVGTFMDPTFTRWMNHIPCMIKANLPITINEVRMNRSLWGGLRLRRATHGKC
ncbi:uncharacterized protein BXZ73DRAFT_58156 [Epithele typhae]|uniref:uncharacterized protein n=1 Tax=Epithele typhae TaxID=378194 RepID=UPI0020085147|nr:uncharacterized protein BXZ73DRAFT_58156 [Epithele typhae]KAH9910524.1 hypothetical protein BXZ73DRAFT_58156 [Epithele typhae]